MLNSQNQLLVVDQLLTWGTCIRYQDETWASQLLRWGSLW